MKLSRFLTPHPRPTEFRILRIYGDLETGIGCFWKSLVQVTEVGQPV